MKESILVSLSEIGEHIRTNETEAALKLALTTLTEIKKLKKDEEFYLTTIFKTAGFFVDIAHLSTEAKTQNKASKIGLDLLEKNESKLIDKVGEFNYFYFLANAKSNLISIKDPFKHDFTSINDLIAHKSLLWKSLKASNFSHHEGLVNLANSLKQQFRLTEALKYYDEAIKCDPNIAPAWVNRSDSLFMLQRVTDSFSISMLEEIRKGYATASQLTDYPVQYRQSWDETAKHFERKIHAICTDLGISRSDYDEHETLNEHESLSEYRKFCLDNYLALSEHSLYCKCNGSERDDLSIPHTGGVTGEFIEPMEKLLNRMKSEFGLARKLYYESTHMTEDQQGFYELGFSELGDDEELGINIEKLRTSFRLCFGILDKIGLGLCEMFNLYPDQSQNVSFTNIWRLDKNEDRLEKLNQLKNPSLLALYSIASDLNDKRAGEWSFFKDYRNALEHEFLVVYKRDITLTQGEYSEFSFKKKIVYVKREEFVSNLLLLLQLTRSAIFSFTYAVRSHSLNNRDDNTLVIPKTMGRKDFLD